MTRKRTVIEMNRLRIPLFPLMSLVLVPLLTACCAGAPGARPGSPCDLRAGHWNDPESGGAEGSTSRLPLRASSVPPALID